MLSFFGKIILLIAAAFGLGTLAGRRGRKKAATQQQAASAPGPTADSPAPSPASVAAPTSTSGAASAKPASTSSATHGSSAPATGAVPDEPASPWPISKPVVGNDSDEGGEALAASARLAATPHDPKPLPDDPLTEKYRAEPFRKNFRSVDYSRLSLDQGAIEAERKRRRQRSSWHAPDPVKDKPVPKPALPAIDPAHRFSGRFASFGGATVSADVIMGGDAGIVPDMTPTLPGDDPASPTKPAVPGVGANPAGPVRPQPARLGGPHPDLPTPDRSKRAAAPPDPLAEKHRAASFDRDWRTLDYGRLREAAASSEKGKPRDWSPKTAAEQAKSATGGDESGADRPAAYPAAFSALGVAAATPGAPDIVGSDRGGGGRLSAAGAVPGARPSGEPITPLGAPGAHEGAMGLEPSRLDAPRGGKPDDLTRIKGIGPTIERLLFEHGVYHFDQIAGWSTAEAQWIEQMIGFAGRVEREDWVAQAMGFAAEGEG